MEYFKLKTNKNYMRQGGNKMQSTKIFLVIIFVIYVLSILITMIKTKRFFTTIFLTVLQGVCGLFAVNLLGQYIAIHIPVNFLTIGTSSIGGLSGVIMMLLCDSFIS